MRQAVAVQRHQIAPQPSQARLRRHFRTAAQVDDREQLAEVIAAGKRGDPEAIRYLYNRFADDVYGYVCTIVRDDHEAEDITQSLFIKLMRVLPKYEERSVPFCAWLLRVARNLALDHLRAQRMVPCEEVCDPEVEGHSDGRLKLEWSLKEALSTLSPDQRRVVIWRHLLGLSPVEIAEHLGKSEGSIHALHHRGRRAMQRELQALDSAPSTLVSSRRAADAGVAVQASAASA
jgi:RNA polymerase sigma-70 factor (ECF subfamily)